MKILSLASVVLLAAASTSCQREEASAPATATAPPAAESPAAVQALPDGTEVVYACQDDKLTVIYSSGEARVTFADRPEVVLPRSTQAGESSQERYETEGTTLGKRGNIVEFDLPESEMVECMEVSSTA